MANEPDYILDVEGIEDDSTSGGGSRGNGNAASQGARSWIGVEFECCGVYQRIYRNRDGSAYEGKCPRCTRPVRVRIGPAGTSCRMFRAH
jgi:hypothetical protein